MTVGTVSDIAPAGPIYRDASCNGSKLTGKMARLFIPRDQMPDNRAAFTAKMEFAPDRAYEIEFRASIIEQHKEIERSIIFVEYSE